jgi:hypothetical protein
MLQQGINLLPLFAQQERVDISQPKRNLQIRVSRALSSTSEFVGYIDVVGQMDGTRCVIDWKMTEARYPDQPEGLLARPAIDLLFLANCSNQRPKVRMPHRNSNRRQCAPGA